MSPLYIYIYIFIICVYVYMINNKYICIHLRACLLGGPSAGRLQLVGFEGMRVWAAKDFHSDHRVNELANGVGCLQKVSVGENRTERERVVS